MSDLEIRRMPNDYAMAILATSWKILKGPHYVILFGTVLLMICISGAIAKIPYLSVFSSLPSVFLGVGHMLIVRKIVAGQPVKFTDLFHAFENDGWLTRLTPLAVASVVIALVSEGLDHTVSAGGMVGGLIGGLLGVCLVMLWAALAAYSAPLIVFKNKSFRESIDLNISVVTLNWKPLLLMAIALLGLIIVCTILLFLPLFFVALPLAAITTYLSYAAMFEGLDVVALGAKVDAVNATTPN